MRKDERGAGTALIGFLVAIAIFTFSIVFFLSNQPARPEELQLSVATTGLQVRAEEGIELIVTSEGLAGGAVAWEKNPEAMVRFGLAAEAGANELSLEKIRLLVKGRLDADPTNGLADYEEVRIASGIGDYQFHLRSYPLLEGVGDGFRPYNLALAYIGHFDLQGVDDAVVAYNAWDGPGYSQVNVSITNTGSFVNLYQVALTLDLPNPGRDVRRDVYSPEVGPGGEATVTARFYDLDWSGTPNVRVKVMGLKGSAYVDADLPLPLGNGAADVHLKAYPARGVHAPGDTATVSVDTFDEEGRRVETAGILLEGLYPNGTLWRSETVDMPRNREATRDWAVAADAPEGTYLVRATLDGRSVDNRFAVRTGRLIDQITQSYVESVDSARERGLLDELIAPFDNVTYVSDPAGDVFRDDKDDAGRLVAALASYEALVVGTNVSHNALNDPGFRRGVGDWVNETGGILIVLGSAAQNSEWLESLYDTGLKTAGGGISAPDPTHAILHSPEELRYLSYKDQGFAWFLKDKILDLFTPVLVKGTGPQGTEAALAVSKPGALGNGTLVLTGYTPSDLTVPWERLEARKFLHNLIAASYGEVFLDYGPPVPDAAPIATSTRLVSVPNPVNQDPLLHMRLVIYVWR
ncbi:MAG: hypothetical protein ACT4PT_01965 [Methanobacteriota archaeon]